VKILLRMLLNAVTCRDYIALVWD